MFNSYGDPAPSRSPFLMMAILGALGFVVTIYFWHQNTLAKEWPTTTGTCQSDPIANSKVLDYQYSVANQTYQLKCLHAAIQPIDQTVQVAYDPVNPAHSVLKAGADNTPILIMSALFSVGMAVVGFFSYAGGATMNTGRYANWRY